MNILDLIRLFAEPLTMAVVMTDIDLERPGPTILYANPAFTGMSGYTAAEVLGATPRLLQGPKTKTQQTRLIARRLRAEGRFHGVLQNYRKSGEAYLCEIDVRPVLDRGSQPLAYLAFEREVARRRGRPSSDPHGRYRPITVDAVDLSALGAAPAIFG